MTSTELSLRLQTSTGKDFTEALAIVVQRRDQSAVPILIGILGRGDVKIVSALAKLGDQRAVAPISNLLNSYGLYSSESHSYLARSAIAARKLMGDQQ